jgi:hypothetical protein
VQLTARDHRKPTIQASLGRKKILREEEKKNGALAARVDLVRVDA